MHQVVLGTGYFMKRDVSDTLVYDINREIKHVVNRSEKKDIAYKTEGCGL